MSNFPAADSSVVSFKPTRKIGHHITAFLMALAVVSLVIATKPNAATSDSAAPQATETANAPSEFVYFPAQYVNQATQASSDVETF
jgi:hypothetical protein